MIYRLCVCEQFSFRVHSVVSLSVETLLTHIFVSWYINKMSRRKAVAKVEIE